MPVRLVRDTAEEAAPSKTIEDLIWDFDSVSRQIKDLEDRKKGLQSLLTDRLRSNQDKSLRVTDPQDGAGDLKIVYVANRRVSVDSAKVKAAMPKGDYFKVRSDDVDREKLDAYLAAASDEVKAQVAAGISITEHPTVRLYRVAKEPVGD
jgi:hypothetical protein